MTARKLPDWMLGKAPASEQKPKFIFTGEIKYSYTSGDFAIACEEILETFADLQEIIIGFDIEWPITSAGSGRTALIQICPDESICYLFHVSQVYNLPIAFINFLSDTRVKLTGINIYNDFWKLVRDFSLKIQFPVQTKLIELDHLTNKVLKCDQKWSLEKLVSYLFKKQIIKDDALRKSNWAADYLTEQQLLYAATDAFASLAVYKEITNKASSI